MYLLLVIIADAIIIFNSQVSLDKCTAAKDALIAVEVKAICVPASEYLK